MMRRSFMASDGNVQRSDSRNATAAKAPYATRGRGRVQSTFMRSPRSRLELRGEPREFDACEVDLDGLLAEPLALGGGSARAQVVHGDSEGRARLRDVAHERDRGAAEPRLERLALRLAAPIPVGEL